MTSIMEKNKGKAKNGVAKPVDTTLENNEGTKLVHEQGNANVATLHDRLAADDDRVNKMLASAADLGETLSKVKEFTAFAHDAVVHKREDDYKSIRCVKHMRDALSPDQLARLPWPKSKPEDVAKTNQPDVFDVLKTKRLNAKNELVNYTTSFYRALAEAIPEGAKAAQDLLDIERAENNNSDAPHVWRVERAGKGNWEAGKAQARQVLNTLSDAMRKAGHIYLQEQRIKELRAVAMGWTRDNSGEIIKSTKPLWICQRDPKSGEQNSGTVRVISVGQFLGFKVDKAKKTKVNGEMLVSVDTLMASSKSAPKAPSSAPSASAVADARFKVGTITDFDKSIGELVAWCQGGNILEQQQRLTSAQSRIKDDDATAYAYDRALRFLRSTGVDMDATQERIKKYVDGLKTKGVDAA